jgi:hypothetical protein
MPPTFRSGSCILDSSSLKRLADLSVPASPHVLARGRHVSGLAPGAEESGIRRTAVNRTPVKSFRCEVISETVTIALRRRTVFGGRGPLFIRCSEVDCQYVDANEPPCPLTLDLFADEIREREAQRTQRR